MPDPGDLHTLVFHSLDEQIAVIDQAGAIVDVNSAWVRFGEENGLSREFIATDSNYLEVLAAAEAAGDRLVGEAARGIRDVLAGRRPSFDFEYPCHSPTQERWFMMHVTGLKDSAERLFVISHQEITQRKIAEERAEYLARHDPLTGLANRRYFSEALGNEMQRSIRSRSVISLILVDVDHFKDYNDARGHPAGDQCLVSVGRALVPFARRPGDLAARLGGDEFALLLGDADFAGSQTIAETIRDTISALDLGYGDTQRITVSLGVASAIPHMHQSENFLLEEADRALYRAKAAGRNRVVHERPDGATRG